MNKFFKWTFTVRRNGRRGPGTGGETSAAAEDGSPVPETGRDRPETQARQDEDSFFSIRRRTERESDIGDIADCARKQVRFLRRMNDLLKSRADGAYYL